MTIEVLERPKERLNTYQKEEILNSLTKEIPQRRIASQYDTSQTTISRINQENKEIVDQRKQELIKLLPDIVETVQIDIDTNKRLSENLSKSYCYATTELIALKGLLDKTNINILKIASIFPTNALLNFNQYNQDNRSINIEPSIMGLFSGGFSDNMEVIDMQGVSDDSDVTNVV